MPGVGDVFVVAVGRGSPLDAKRRIGRTGKVHLCTIGRRRDRCRVGKRIRIADHLPAYLTRCVTDGMDIDVPVAIVKVFEVVLVEHIGVHVGHKVTRQAIALRDSDERYHDTSGLAYTTDVDVGTSGPGRSQAAKATAQREHTVAHLGLDTTDGRRLYDRHFIDALQRSME